jgi:hypothetical protein
MSRGCVIAVWNTIKIANLKPTRDHTHKANAMQPVFLSIHWINAIVPSSILMVNFFLYSQTFLTRLS